MYQWQTLHIFICPIEQGFEFQEHLKKYVFFGLEEWCQKWQFHLQLDVLYMDIASLEKEQGLKDEFKNCFWVFLTRENQEISDMPQIQRKYFYTATRDSIEFFQTLAEKITEDIKRTLSEDFQARIAHIWESKQDIWKNEQFCHRAFIESHLRSFVCNDSLNEKLEKYICGASKNFFLLYGEEGVGKSAVLSNLVRDIESKEEYKNFTCIPFFVGASPQSNSMLFLLQTLCREIRSIASLQHTVPFEYSRVVRVFRDFLKQKSKKIVIILDGIDRLNLEVSADPLHWLPNELPRRIKIIVSSQGEISNSLLQKTKISHRVTFSMVQVRKLLAQHGELNLLWEWLLCSTRTIKIYTRQWKMILIAK